MNALALIPYYIIWHYSIAFRDIFRVWKNFLWFIFHFFSVGIILKTFISPWRRLSEEKGKIFEPRQFFSALAINTLMRIVGVFIRTVMLIVAFTAIVLVFIAGILFFVFWAFAPFLIFATIINGTRQLF